MRRLKIELKDMEKALKRVKFEKQQLQNKLEEQKSEKEQLQKKLEEQNKSCKICNEPYNDTERETVKLECPHVFCKKCTIQVLSIGNSLCPYCRKYFKQFYPVKF